MEYRRYVRFRFVRGVDKLLNWPWVDGHTGNHRASSNAVKVWVSLDHCFDMGNVQKIR